MTARLIFAASYLFAAAVLLAGCTKSVPVPVAFKREVPRPPAECRTDKDPIYPRLAVKPGQVIDPGAAAHYSISARQWAEVMKARRRVCGVYTKRMQTWR